jgi:hypothetical protein
MWVFGGWAEELQGMSSPRTHIDIDLLLRAPDFDQLDLFFKAKPEICEIKAKRFPHKRAVIWNGVMVEFMLVQQEYSSYYTNLFDITTYRWGCDTFSEESVSTDIPMKLVSRDALDWYRRQYYASGILYQSWQAGRKETREGRVHGEMLKDEYIGGFHLGRLQGAKESMLLLGQKRFGEPSENTLLTIFPLSSLEQVYDLRDRLLEVGSWDELLNKESHRAA